MTHAEFVVGFHAGLIRCSVAGWRVFVARAVIARALEDAGFYDAMRDADVLRIRADAGPQRFGVLISRAEPA